MTRRLTVIVFMGILALSVHAAAGETPISDATAECLDCHSIIHPGIVRSWANSRHAASTPNAATAVEGLERKVSATDIPAGFADVAVGCAECHTLRAGAHADTFEHNGYDIHVVVSPPDCGTCHAVEARQYGENIMSHAYGNLADNPVYQVLEDTIIGKPGFRGPNLSFSPADPATKAGACYYCHGTKLAVTDTEVRDTELAGALEFPVISGWPNQGAGRINLDGSRGACSACHPRHGFSMETARKPHTCSECHIGPDVPAYKVYQASKHGNMYASTGGGWDYNATPWVVGKDFTAPTCAACHISLLVNTEGDTVADRTHRMSGRLPWRIFGLIYAHPQPKSPDTTVIRNKDGLPLPTDFSGGFATDDLIGETEMAAREKTMQAVCLSCHDASWVAGFWQRFEDSIDTTNNRILKITGILSDIWNAGGAEDANPFDEAVERKWTDAWLFYANSIRFSSAMAGGGDYSVFADGHYHLTQRLIEIHDWKRNMGDTRTAPATTLEESP